MDTENRYDKEKFTPPFRLGKKQKRAVLDSKGHLVILMPHNNEKQAQMYCDYLNEEDKQESYSKTESELTKSEKDLLLAEMIQIWGKNPKENKFRFSQMIIKS